MDLVKKIFMCLALVVTLWGEANAQSAYTDTLASNPHTTNNIQNYDVMWKKSLWFRVNLFTKVNEGFFAKNHELTKVLIDAVKNDMIIPFRNDSLETRMSKEEFLAAIRVPQVELEEDLDDDWNEWGGADANAGGKATVKEEYDARDFYFVDLRVDRVFDRRRSRMYNDVVAITLVLPAEHSRKKVDRTIASFSFRELDEQVFHVNRQGQKIRNPEAIWYNSMNPAQHMNLSDAFAMNMYDGRLVKYENPKDNSIIDLYGENKKSFYKSLDAVYKLMEYEAMLWSY